MEIAGAGCVLRCVVLCWCGLLCCAVLCRAGWCAGWGVAAWAQRSSGLLSPATAPVPAPPLPVQNTPTTHPLPSRSLSSRPNHHPPTPRQAAWRGSRGRRTASRAPSSPPTLSGTRPGSCGSYRRADGYGTDTRICGYANAGGRIAARMCTPMLECLRDITAFGVLWRVLSRGEMREKADERPSRASDCCFAEKK